MCRTTHVVPWVYLYLWHASARNRHMSSCDKGKNFPDMKRDLDEQVSTEEFQQACEQASLRLMREITVGGFIMCVKYFEENTE